MVPSLRTRSYFLELTQDLRPGLSCAAPFDFAQGRLYRGWGRVAGAAQKFDPARVGRDGIQKVVSKKRVTSE
jgi:hypothetical protein